MSSIQQPSKGLTSFSGSGSAEFGLSMITTSSLLITDTRVEVVLKLVTKDMNEVDVVGVVSDGLGIENC